MATRKKLTAVKGTTEPKQRKPRKKKDAFHLDQLDDSAKDIVRLEKSLALIEEAFAQPQSPKAHDTLVRIQAQLNDALTGQVTRFVDLAAYAGVEGAEYAVEFLAERYPPNETIPDEEHLEPVNGEANSDEIDGPIESSVQAPS